VLLLVGLRVRNGVTCNTMYQITMHQRERQHGVRVFASLLISIPQVIDVSNTLDNSMRYYKSVVQSCAFEQRRQLTFAAGAVVYLRLEWSWSRGIRADCVHSCLWLTMHHQIWLRSTMVKVSYHKPMIVPAKHKRECKHVRCSLAAGVSHLCMRTPNTCMSS
jgi:hypothetical protein